MSVQAYASRINRVVMNYLAVQLGNAIQSRDDLKRAFPELHGEDLNEARRAAVWIQNQIQRMVGDPNEKPVDGKKWVDPDRLRTSIGFIRNITQNAFTREIDPG